MWQRQALIKKAILTALIGISSPLFFSLHVTDKTLVVGCIQRVLLSQYRIHGVLALMFSVLHSHI